MRVISLFLLLTCHVYGQTSDSLLNTLIKEDPVLSEVFNDTTFRMQFMFISFDSGKMIDMSNEKYFYPASTVKLPVAIVTMEKMQRLGVQLDDRLVVNDNVHCGNRNFVSKSQSQQLTFRKLISELLVVSDNDYYNMLYHFVTPKELNDRLSEMGFSGSSIYRSFSGCDKFEHLHTNSCDVFRGDSVVCSQPESILEDSVLFSRYSYSKDRLFGSKHEHQNRIKNGPFDLNYHLEIPLSEIYEMMWRLCRPDNFRYSAQWNLNEENRSFLTECLMKFPSELNESRYSDARKWPDNIYKYAIHGEEVDTSYSVYSKLGLSYGFTTEVAYIIRKEDEAAYLLSVSMYTNANDTVNDGKYEYETLARPFISRLSKTLVENY